MVAVGIVLLPQDRWSLAKDRWRRAEAWGFDHAWTYDHLAWRTLADGPWFATVPLLAAAAAVTERIALGTFVASPNFRHPVPFAKDVLGLDDVSGGRFVLGIGAGGEGFDASVTGPAWSRGERTRRYEEFVALLDTLLTQPVTEFTGEFYEAHDARMHPGTVARPRTPFAMAAAGPRTMALAARYGQGWVTYGPALGADETADDPLAAQERWWAGLADTCAQVDAVEAAAGRDGSTLPRLRRYLSLDGAPLFSLSSLDLAVEGVERAAGLGFTDVVVHWPRPEGVYGGSEAVLEEFAERLPGLQALPVAAR
ncbi:LLM class flavin-dependent oxidoreductase [Cellulomonas fimi]|uniref:Luciferase-like, subgroup n=1 Tax=Cellulomonas fimi (strain ATCC 484 / DSM 20113 / JCM 1341 / CCUG 24087 / LMG 16345 / NBRC 15513 / NCIMB 8980 / NCTC 7547 / NRS-133) TaxID=590998 RepID=F4GZX1_CELFA|nr:LLM class flavin-dependent oxidoreductase [Cellulomonas fimi]AEE47287.1 Luciferase-like, subgroup [Cellulomonas fimi ATCC 484]NNH07001.1 LLM class flavin-dependent oxidoreductase [Cellulomonas fimi]VEH35812.1 F420-dependent glucose-6-phosphate dehydrogenase [Cellulomonas fimi]